MRFFTFLDTKYTNMTVENMDNYKPGRDGALKGIQFIITVIRFFGKWCSIPKIIGEYFLVEIGFLPTPQSRLPELKDRQRKK